MSSYSKLIATTGLILVLGLSSIAEASPIGTPAANRIPTGKGKSFGGLFDDMVGSDHDKQDAGASVGQNGKSKHRHLTSAEWHRAYIAKHGHEPPAPQSK